MTMTTTEEKSVLTGEQEARAEALRIARAVLMNGTTVFGGTSGFDRASFELIEIADYILFGTPPEGVAAADSAPNGQDGAVL
jgi:hypothetical protein